MSKASVVLTAMPDEQGTYISLRWNMVNHSSVTAYILLKSYDGVVWQTAAANPVYRNYNASTTLAYSDKIIERKKLFYRVKIYDTHDNTVAVSNTAVTGIAKAVYGVPQRQSDSRATNTTRSSSVASWALFPNPVTDILNITYKRSERIMGVINVLISDATGKIIIRFRQASNNKQLHIPVSNLRAGLYFIKIDVLNERQLNEKFIKQ
ncbi:MAG: T9SS type A sorting domain-containing protein [Ginsengibacter sp.]